MKATLTRFTNHLVQREPENPYRINGERVERSASAKYGDKIIKKVIFLLRYGTSFEPAKSDSIPQTHLICINEFHPI
jgi:hypothetical protein